MRYQFDPTTGELLPGEAEASYTSIEPDVPYWPVNCTEAKPPVRGESEAVVYQDGKWVIAPDHRGETWFTEDGVPSVVNAIGDPADRGLLPDAPPVDVPPPAIPSVSPRQFFQALAVRGHITEDEALDAAGAGVVPAAMLALITQLPVEQQFGAKMLIRGATVYERNNALAGLIGSLYGWDDAALDEFWTFAASL